MSGVSLVKRRRQPATAGLYEMAEISGFRVTTPTSKSSGFKRRTPSFRIRRSSSECRARQPCLRELQCAHVAAVLLARFRHIVARLRQRVSPLLASPWVAHVPRGTEVTAVDAEDYTGFPATFVRHTESLFFGSIGGLGRPVGPPVRPEARHPGGGAVALARCFSPRAPCHVAQFGRRSTATCAERSTPDPDAPRRAMA